MGQTVYTYNGWANAKLTITHDGEQLLSFSGPAYGNNGAEATESFSVALPTPPPFIGPPCYCTDHQWWFRGQCEYPDCTGTDGTELETDCLCGNNVLDSGYCFGSYWLEFPACTNTDGTVQVTNCDCNGESVSSGYCYGTFSNEYPPCANTDGTAQVSNCACNYVDITSGYCYGTYHSEFPECSDTYYGDCSCSSGHDCTVDELCSNGKCLCDIDKDARCRCTPDIILPFGCKCGDFTCGVTDKCHADMCVSTCPTFVDLANEPLCHCNGIIQASGACGDCPDGSAFLAGMCNCGEQQCGSGTICVSGTCNVITACTIDPNQRITDACYCDGLIVLDGFCHGSGFSVYSQCDTGAISNPCYCNGNRDHGFCLSTGCLLYKSDAAEDTP